jgi:aryl-alcohol dehydrogenase-like predicted oxidoreductase
MAPAGPLPITTTELSWWEAAAVSKPSEDNIDGLTGMGRGDVAIRRHQFGGTDLTVSEFGLGCARIGGIFKNEPREFVELLSAALDAGITFFDTSNIYSQGESETLIGRAFRHRRDEVVIASKAGYVLPSQRRLIARIKPFVRPLIRALGVSRQHLPAAVRGSLSQDFSPGHLRRSVEDSLRRLHTDRIDLFQLHSPPVDVVELGDWVAALETLKQQGKIRYYGVSCDSVDAAVAALRHSGVSAIQVPINLFERSAIPVLPIAREQGVGVIARESLANGLLVKELSPTEIRSYCQSDAEAEDKARQLDHHRRTAAERGGTLTQLALQFVTALAGVSTTLIGVSRLQQLEALLATALPAARR